MEGKSKETYERNAGNGTDSQRAEDKIYGSNKKTNKYQNVKNR
jgi:hypothetical protein